MIPSLGQEPMNAPRDTAIFKSDIRAMPEAARLLGELVADPTRLTTLFDLQRCLLRRVRSRERYIIRVRRLHRKLRTMLRTERPAKGFAKQIKTSVRTCDERIAMARYSIFLWKCFGDGAACVYQSPYNLKHLYYDQDYRVKQEAGFLTGKVDQHGTEGGNRKANASVTTLQSS